MALSPPPLTPSPPLPAPLSFSTQFVNAAASESNGFTSFFDTGGTGACVGCEAGRDGDLIQQGRVVKEEKELEIKVCCLSGVVWFLFHYFPLP